MRPFSVTIKHVKCFSTNDLTGSDDLVGVIGPVRFRIGSFAAGDEVSLDVGHVVPAGEVFLKIVEDDLTGDDDIGLIDLTEVFDADRTRNIQGGGANYDITFFVESTD